MAAPKEAVASEAAQAVAVPAEAGSLGPACPGLTQNQAWRQQVGPSGASFREASSGREPFTNVVQALHRLAVVSHAAATPHAKGTPAGWGQEAEATHWPHGVKP